MKASTQARQLRIIDIVLKMKDDGRLEALEELLRGNHLPSLSEMEENALREGIEDFEAGRVHTHQEMLKVLDESLGLVPVKG